MGEDAESQKVSTHVCLRGESVVVDDVDDAYVASRIWRAKRGRGATLYALSTWYDGSGKQCDIRLHRALLGLPIDDPRFVDHINGDGLDNRRKNLRVVTRRQNSFNIRNAPNVKKGAFKGVYLVPSGRYIAKIVAPRPDGAARASNVCLGTFDTPEEAARAYDAKAREQFGEFAACNFPESV